MERQIVLKRIQTILLCIIIVFCVCVGICCKMGTAERGHTYKFRPIDILYVYAISPLLWACVGMLAGSLTGIGKRLPVILRRVMAIAAWAVLLAVACAIMLHINGGSAAWVQKIMHLCIMRPKLLMIPGLVCGLSMKL